MEVINRGTTLTDTLKDEHTWMEFFGLSFIIGMFYAPFLQSASIFFWGFTGIYAIYRGNSCFRQQKHATLLWFSLPFWIYLISGWNSEDLSIWSNHLRIKVPFVMVPMVFLMLPFWKETVVRRLHDYLLGIGLFSAILVVIDYQVDKSIRLESIGRGTPLSTPTDHIRYGLMIGYAVISQLSYMMSESSKKVSNTLRVFRGVAVTLLVLFIHFLSVRTGLVVLYGGGIYLILRFFILQKKWARVILGFTALLIGFSLSYYLFPSLQKKIDYTLFDWEQFDRGFQESVNYSDGGRVYSWGAGLEVLRENFWIGTGVGDLKASMEQQFQHKGLDMPKFLYPHSQFLFVVCSVGLFGFLLFFWGYFQIFFRSAWRHRVQLQILGILAFVTFTYENQLEIALGTAIFVVLPMWFIFQQENPLIEIDGS